MRWRGGGAKQSLGTTGRHRGQGDQGVGEVLGGDRGIEVCQAALGETHSQAALGNDIGDDRGRQGEAPSRAWRDAFPSGAWERQGTGGAGVWGDAWGR